MAAAALLGVANTANAQLSMQMGNGWNATFSGNVNAFYIYNSTSDDTGGGDSFNSGKSNGIGTGLLPAFFVFDAKGKEGNTDLGVHFGFAPQVSAGNNVASFFGNQAAGAQIDMRQVYATVGGTWGTILFGKELGIFQRQNILQDITLFGVGPSSVGRGTALGRIGYGYLYTDFRPQFSYATPAGKPFSLTVGVLDPITVGAYEYADMPRFEAEFTYKSTFGTDKKNSFLLFASGAYGHAKAYASDDLSPNGDNPGISQTGFSGGAKIDVGGFALTGSGFFASGMGTLFMGDAILGDPTDGKVCIDCLDGNGDAQDTYGWYAQAIYTLPNSKAALGASYGGNYVSDPAATGDFSDRTALVFQGTYFITKSTRVVAEYTNFQSKFEGVDGSVSTNQFALGMMLFY
jgi:hypothetical protein